MSSEFKLVQIIRSVGSFFTSAWLWLLYGLKEAVFVDVLSERPFCTARLLEPISRPKETAAFKKDRTVILQLRPTKTSTIFT